MARGSDRIMTNIVSMNIKPIFQPGNRLSIAILIICPMPNSDKIKIIAFTNLKYEKISCSLKDKMWDIEKAPIIAKNE